MRPITSVSTHSSHHTFKSETDTCKAEEIRNAPRVIPLSMVTSSLLNGSLGFAMLITLLFCMPSDIQSVLNSETYYPFMGIYTHAVGSVSGATALVSSPNNFFGPLPSFQSFRGQYDYIPYDTVTNSLGIFDVCDSRLTKRRSVLSSSIRYSPPLAL